MSFLRSRNTPHDYQGTLLGPNIEVEDFYSHLLVPADLPNQG